MLHGKSADTKALQAKMLAGPCFTCNMKETIGLEPILYAGEQFFCLAVIFELLSPKINCLSLHIGENGILCANFYALRIIEGAITGGIHGGIGALMTIR